MKTLKACEPVDTTKPFLRIREICNLTGLCERTIWKWEASGKIPRAIRKSRKVVLWKTADVLAWIENGME